MTAAVVLVLLALLPPYIGLYQTQLLTYGLIAAIAALGLNLLLGYTGLLSFGHSAFFGIGAYSVAFLLRYADIHSMELYVLIGLPIAAVISALFGYICVRHTRIFFGILTLALSQVLWTLAYKFFWVTGGSDGLRVARPTLLAGMLSFTGGGSFQRFINAYYYYVLGVFAISVVIMWVIVHSPFGKALQAIRDNETRAAFLGLRIRRFRLISFLISGTFTGLAGILWVPLNGLTTPEVLYWPFSGEIVFTTLLGGFRNFTGPIVGGVLFTYLKTYAVATTEYWQLLLGVVLVLLVMLLPTGIVGAISAVADSSGRRRNPRDPSRDGRSQQAVRRRSRLRWREFHRQQGRISLARGLERRRQDLARQSDQRTPQAEQRPHPVRGRGRHLRHRIRTDQGRHRSQLPNRQSVRRA